MINLVVALSAEARPLVHRFGLRRDRAARGFKLFRGDDVNLVVSGVGMIRAAGAVGWLQGISGDDLYGWINVGIAGHPDRVVGETLLIHRITDAASGRSWYPPVMFDPGCPTGQVITVSLPESEYSSDAAYDMEAAGMYPVASRFATAELVQCIKVISDNRENPPERLDGARISALVDHSAGTVAVIAENLAARVAEMREHHATLTRP